MTNSILPSLVLHAGGNMLASLDLLTRGRAEWQTTAVRQPLIWQTGTDALFWMATAGLLFFTGAAVWAYSALAVVARSRRSREAPVT